jgi:thioesterase domain-containing protein
VAVGTFGLETRPSELTRRLMRSGQTAFIPEDMRPQIVFFPGMWGDDVNTSDFCRLLSLHFRVMAIDPRLGGDGLTDGYDAVRYFSSATDAIRRAGPHRRLWMVGFSFGGKLAVETARRLLASGTAVEAVVVLDGEVQASARRLKSAEQARRGLRGSPLRSGLDSHGGAARYLLNAAVVRMAPIVVRLRATRILRALLALVRRFGSVETLRNVSRSAISQTRRRALGVLPAGSLPMAIWLLVTDDPFHDPARPDLSWDDHCQVVNRIAVGGTHYTMLSPPTRDVVVAELMRLYDALDPDSSAELQNVRDEVA